MCDQDVQFFSGICTIILFLFHYSFLSAISSLLHAVNKVILAAFIVG
ncbi:hypothetical protein BV215_11760 [Klebsiella pneumoniae]|nr:hypothetical protein BV215_11760 [Klebsiella pneumoniae]